MGNTATGVLVLDDEYLKYQERLRSLSQASVDVHFDPFTDIDWDSPEFAIIPDDPRWILPTEDPLGAHPWYRAQPIGRQIEIGMWRMASICKVGLHFEQLLIRGLMQYAASLPNSDPEFRYITHECAEECNHTMMFQELVDRIGMDDVIGMGPVDRLLTHAIWPLVDLFPEAFFTMVLGGEEPIDHLQKSILRGQSTMHPIMTRIMAIHVAEEARHISFAHEYLKRNAPKLGRTQKFTLSLFMPLVMRVMAEMIATPPVEFVRKFQIPRAVMKDLYWDAPESSQALSDIFADMRALARNSDLINPFSKAAWRALGIWGRESRYRSEPGRI